jgi:predicted enzyme related to lactoylglutathione lyase
MAGSIVHLEIPAGDVGAVQAFWGALLGVEFQAFEGSPTPYLMARLSETTGSAIYGTEEPKRGTRPYFDVDDIRSGIAKVKELGGEASEPMPVPSMGWFATCSDVEGNDFGLWQSDESATM